MDEQTTFPAGTQAQCNRCKMISTLPKPCQGHTETIGGNVYRLDTMCVLDCGHMDAHWVFTR